MGGRRGHGRRVRSFRAAGLAALTASALVGSWLLGPLPGAGASGVRRVVAVGAENEYANVLAQIGGRDIQVTSVMSNPDTDPHTFEASPAVAREVSNAALIVQNGLGYDTFMQTIEAASPNRHRRVIDVATLLDRPATTPNPHLWYDPATMPKVAKAVAKALGALDPVHRAYFHARLERFDASLRPWKKAIATLRARFSGTPVAVTEPVADDMLAAAGLKDMTPIRFQADVMNGVDPSPQDVALVEGLLTHKKVKAFVYNVQVTDTLTQSLLALARSAHIPVVGVYETMPTPGFTYQRWMVAEVQAVTNALSRRVSAPRLTR